MREKKQSDNEAVIYVKEYFFFIQIQIRNDDENDWMREKKAASFLFQ